jgi:hypothetical protein
MHTLAYLFRRAMPTVFSDAFKYHLPPRRHPEPMPTCCPRAMLKKVSACRALPLSMSVLAYYSKNYDSRYWHRTSTFENNKHS